MRDAVANPPAPPVGRFDSCAESGDDADDCAVAVIGDVGIDAFMRDKFDPIDPGDIGPDPIEPNVIELAPFCAYPICSCSIFVHLGRRCSPDGCTMRVSSLSKTRASASSNTSRSNVRSGSTKVNA